MRHRYGLHLVCEELNRAGYAHGLVKVVRVVSLGRLDSAFGQVGGVVIFDGALLQ